MLKIQECYIINIFSQIQKQQFSEGYLVMFGQKSFCLDDQTDSALYS